jgi:hypothetical protein
VVARWLEELVMLASYVAGALAELPGAVYEGYVRWGQAVRWSIVEGGLWDVAALLAVSALIVYGTAMLAAAVLALYPRGLAVFIAALAAAYVVAWMAGSESLMGGVKSYIYLLITTFVAALDVWRSMYSEDLENL